ncbi:MAG: purine-nucleoside/S-methyl-5-thioadenosine phosphorylase / adenosine deaminase, partial [Actinomycetota bacterium]|nr:purine-nucleoside/S-methyl-5-thioadenosine phosphorylase / adenosine deaminase [Actinomycetota bacterium]
PEPALAADAAVTSARGLAVASLSADCVLLVLADPAEGVIATAHCGRQGLVAGIVPAVLASMRVEGARTIRAAVGPAVCGTCYEVPAELADEVAAVVPIARSVGVTGAPALDIRAGVLSQLRDGGAEIVRLVGGCTREDPSAFSYRRDKVTGRMAALVWRPA